MWREIVLAAGITLCLLGGEFMVVDRLVIADNGTAARVASDFGSTSYGGWGSTGSRRVFVPPEWAPWGLLSGGVLTVLYGSALSQNDGS
ncbi:MAG TPA: hypothetical protein VIY86_10495 [Pirellulaceae bacterium]